MRRLRNYCFSLQPGNSSRIEHLKPELIEYMIPDYSEHLKPGYNYHTTCHIQTSTFCRVSLLSINRWRVLSYVGLCNKTGLRIEKRPRFLSDNGSCYVSGDLKEFLEDHSIDHVRGKPHHPQTLGKIELYHPTMKNIIRLEHYYSPEELENQLAVFVDHYKNHRTKRRNTCKT